MLVVEMIMMVVIVGSGDLGRLFMSPVRKAYDDLGGPYPAAVYRSDVDGDNQSG